jgi:polar amino acid transport system substrate-binding protein
VRLCGCLVVLSAISAVGCDGLPRDPEGTLKRVQGGKLRVGLVENPPWVVRTSGEPGGAEAELVRRMAAQLKATPEWVWGGEQQHFEALERFELDLVVGGLTDDTPWRNRVGLTGEYFKDRLTLGFPTSTPPSNLNSLRVQVKSGDAIASYLKKKNAVPISVGKMNPEDGAAAGPDWQLEALGFTPTNENFQTRKHVWGVPPGENAWLKRIEEFFDGQRSEIKGLLQKEVRGR